MEREKISVIVPIYNNEKHLENCLKSLGEQSYENIEFILIDDGSTDMSSEICKYFSLHITSSGTVSVKTHLIPKT